MKMRIIIILLGLFCIKLSICAQIAGLYDHYGLLQIRISGDSLTIYSPESNPFGYCFFAECTIKKEAGKFYSIESTHTPSYYAYEGMSIEYRNEEGMDSNAYRVEFVLPNNQYPVRADILSESNDTVVADMVIPKGSGYVDIAKMTNEESAFRFQLFTLKNVGRNSDDTFYGVMLFPSEKSIPLRSNANCVRITCPNFKTALHTMYYIKHDYVKIRRNKLVWRGDIFKKVIDDTVQY